VSAVARINTRTQIMCAALGAVVIGGVVAVVGLVHDDPAQQPEDVAELLGGPPGIALGPPSSVAFSAAPTTTVVSTTSRTSTAPKPSAPAARPGGFPQVANTGVLPGVALAVVNGDQTFSGNGQVIEGKDFHGFVKVTGKNVTFKNCVFRGRATGSNAALLDADTAVGTQVLDSEFAPSSPSATIDDIWVSSGSVLRANIHGGVDGVKAGTGALIQDSWIHDLSWFAHDPNQGGGETHNDGVQSFAGESNVTLRHNTIDLASSKNANAGWQSSASDSRVENNVFDGGGCMLNFDHKSAGHPLGGIAIVGNRFGRHSAFDCPILLSSQSSLSVNSGNVWSDTGQPIPPPQQHD
jgi:hypothetical protein